MSLDIEPRAFGKAFAVPDASRHIVRATPAMWPDRQARSWPGWSLSRPARLTEASDALHLDKGAEWWAGWACAIYQWYSDRR